MANIPDFTDLPVLINYPWDYQFTVPLLFDDSLSLLQKVNGLYANQQEIVKALQDYNTAFTAWAKEVESDITALENARYFNTIMIGDSYGQGYTPDGNVTSWIDTLKMKYFTQGKNFSAAEGGSGFVATGQAGNTFLGLLEKVVSSMSDDEKSHCEKIIVAGGWNDIFYATDTAATAIANAIVYFVQRAHVLLPKATVYIGFIATCGYSNLNTEEKWNKWKQCKTAYETAWADYKILTGADMALRWFGIMSSDWVHPNGVGQGSIADSIAKAIDGANDSYRYTEQLYIKNAMSDDAVSYNLARMSIRNHVARIDIGNPTGNWFGISFKSAVDFDADSVILNHNFSNINEEATCTCLAVWQNSTGWHTTPAVLILNRNHDGVHDYNQITIRLYDGTGFAKGVTALQLYGISFNVVLS